MFRIDLSPVISKYIGETGKNIDQGSKVADYRDFILLFDEADALFGKRNKVKDGNDRYANADSKLLIQRLKCFSGIVSLTTNLQTYFDQSFKPIARLPIVSFCHMQTSVIKSEL